VAQDVDTDHREPELGEYRVPHAREEILIAKRPILGSREHELVRRLCSTVAFSIVMTRGDSGTERRACDLVEPTSRPEISASDS
jgi:hypothetical protein